MVYGFCRISTIKQNLQRQMQNILRYYSEAKIIEEKFTGTTTDRPEWGTANISDKIHAKNLSY